MPKHTHPNRKKAAALCLGVLLSLLLCACGDLAGFAGPEWWPFGGQAAESGESAPPAALPTPATAQECRDLIAQRWTGGDVKLLDADTLAYLRHCYGELKTMADFTEADYLTLERICEAQGDARARWQTLYEAYCIFPGKDKADRLAQARVPLTEEEAAQLARIIDALPEGGAASIEAYDALNEVMVSEEWGEVFLHGDGAIPKNSFWRQEGEVWQVSQGALRHSLLHLLNGAFVYLEKQPQGGALLVGDMGEEGVSGPFTLRRYDGDGACTLSLTGTMSRGHMTGVFTVTYGDTLYTGALDQEGHVETIQRDGVEALIYAYDGGGQNYLYTEDADRADFVMDGAFWGLPQLTLWGQEADQAEQGQTQQEGGQSGE